jgi:hypothetical protein
MQVLAHSDMNGLRRCGGGLRFIYADTGLRDSTGHHANTCRAVVGDLSRRGIPASVFAFHDASPALQAEVGAVPHFRHFSYTATDGDPICGWLNAFHIGAQLVHEDLQRLPDIGADDILFFSTAMPAVLMGLVSWLHGRPRTAWPQIVVELGTDTGLDPAPSGGQSFNTRDPRLDPRAAFYRFAGARIPKDAASHLHLFYVDAYNAEIFTSLLQFPVKPLPSFYAALGPLHKRGTSRPLTIGVLGHQKPVKGYHLMPEIAEHVLRFHGDCRILLHNCFPEQMPDTQSAVRSLAAREPRVIVDERAVDAAAWTALIDSIDIALCPYDAQHYALMPSGLAAEAVANAVPLIGPAGTSLDRLIREYGGCGTVFERFEAQSIATAAVRALEGAESYAELAHAAAAKWAQRNGFSRAVDTMLAAAGR